MDISVGEYKVYESGSVIGIFGQPITFQIENLTFTFQFVSNPEQSEMHVKTEKVSSTHLKIDFINFDSSLGIGSTEPIRFGNLDDKDLYFQYRINTLGPNAGKLLHYTWLLGEQTKKGGEDAEKGK